MSTTITAAVARTQKAPLSIETLHLDDIRPNEARVRLVATGVCHTDAIVRDGIYPMPLPAVLGHEARASSSTWAQLFGQSSPATMS